MVYRYVGMVGQASTQELRIGSDYMEKGIVLIVDDDAGMRNFLRDLFEMLSYQVEEAANGCEALERLIECTPSLIVLDLMMPEMDGVRFAQALQSQHLSYPLLACSASDTVQEFAQQIAAIGYVEKPFHIGQLLNVLSHWMTNSSRLSPPGDVP